MKSGKNTAHSNIVKIDKFENWQGENWKNGKSVKIESLKKLKIGTQLKNGKKNWDKKRRMKID